MVNYRRNYQEGRVYFFTVTLKNRQSDLLVKHIDLIQNAIRDVKSTMTFKTIATVILPDHIHALWQLPIHDSDYSGRWRSIKSQFTFSLNKIGYQLIRDKRGEYCLWQRRFWEHTIRNDEDLQNHINYIHYNPVKHGLVKRVVDWPYSTFHHYVKKGIYERGYMKAIGLLIYHKMKMFLDSKMNLIVGCIMQC